ncbi:MAG: M6 family metalloprotease domain-containing protein [Prevotella sp.]|nr:M6 family metalloprotease domain-containing protein [Prevotella sp.]
MRRLHLLLTTIIFLTISSVVKAIPADPTPVKVQQPDGSSVTLVLRGDEWLHFNTTEDGYTVVKNNEGYYVYALKDGGQLIPSLVVAHDAKDRQSEEVAFLAGITKYQMPPMSEENRQKMKEGNHRRQVKLNATRRNAKHTYDNFRGLVILVEFNDMKFSRDDYKEIMNDMINKKNYTGYDNEQFTGSMRDYFYDNSNGKFDPQFDIAGPYTVNYSQYDGSTRSTSIMRAAVDSADVDVNFKDYDLDGDGTVDVLYFLFAGYAANFNGNDERLLWPHEHSLIQYNTNKDDVRMGTYSCSTELYGWTSNPSSIKINGIGTMCHEFSHALGLPDFYDTTYSNISNPGGWSVMAGGNSNNYGRNPVGYSLYERWALGFCDEPEIISTVGDYTLPPLFQEQKGYRINTPNENEYFLLENRQNNLFKWDSELPASGMLVFRVDRSDLKPWNNNTVNDDSTHLCYELIRANGGKETSAKDVFPGKGNYIQTTLSNYTSPAHLKTWDGKDNDFALTDIQMNNNIITFHLTDYTEAVIPAIKMNDRETASGNCYNLHGQRVSDNYKGLVIVNGKKVMKK